MVTVFSGTRVRVQAVGRYWEAILIRARARNAVDFVMRDELALVFGRAAIAQDRPVVGLVADGPDFCAGGDLSEFGTTPDVVTAWHVRLIRSLPLLFHDLHDRLVVGVHGNTIGAGVELAAFSDCVIAATDARFMLPELQFGLVPGSGGMVSIPRRIGVRHAVEMLLFGQYVDSTTALRWGLVDRVVSAGELRKEVRRQAEAKLR